MFFGVLNEEFGRPKKIISGCFPIRITYADDQSKTAIGCQPVRRHRAGCKEVQSFFQAVRLMPS
jgi:hypothetical protein